MNIINFFWNNPYPETILWPIVKGFNYLTSRLEKKHISDSRYRILCIILSIVSCCIFLLLTETKNVFEIFVNIPIYNFVEFGTIVKGNLYALYMYMFSSIIFVAIIIYLIRLFVLCNKNYSFFSINGICFFIMSIFVSALIDVIVQKAVYLLYKNMVFSVKDTKIITAVVLGLTLNFIAYFAIQETFVAIFSSMLGIGIIFLFQTHLQQFIYNKLLLLVVVSMVLRAFFELINKIGIWQPFINFIAKWCYTPKYTTKVAFSIIGAIFFWMHFLWKDENK